MSKKNVKTLYIYLIRAIFLLFDAADLEIDAYVFLDKN